MATDPRHLDVPYHLTGAGRTATTGEDDHIRDMIFSVRQIVAFISSVMTLYPGDVIMTGTPAGVGPLVSGDEVCVEIAGLGILKNRVAEEKKPPAAGAAAGV